MGLDNKVPAGFRRGWRGGQRPENFRVKEARGRWVVEQNRPCINGLMFSSSIGNGRFPVPTMPSVSPARGM